MCVQAVARLPEHSCLGCVLIEKKCANKKDTEFILHWSASRYHKGNYAWWPTHCRHSEIHQHRPQCRPNEVTWRAPQSRTASSTWFKWSRKSGWDRITAPWWTTNEWPSSNWGWHRWGRKRRKKELTYLLSIKEWAKLGRWDWLEIWQYLREPSLQDLDLYENWFSFDDIWWIQCPFYLHIFFLSVHTQDNYVKSYNQHFSKKVFTPQALQDCSIRIFFSKTNSAASHWLHFFLL